MWRDRMQPSYHGPASHGALLLTVSSRSRAFSVAIVQSIYVLQRVHIP